MREIFIVFWALTEASCNSSSSSSSILFQSSYGGISMECGRVREFELSHTLARLWLVVRIWLSSYTSSTIKVTIGTDPTEEYGLCISPTSQDISHPGLEAWASNFENQSRRWRWILEDHTIIRRLQDLSQASERISRWIFPAVEAKHSQPGTSSRLRINIYQLIKAASGKDSINSRRAESMDRRNSATRNTSTFWQSSFSTMG